MKILSPANDLSEIRLLTEYGCHELYIGVLTNEWRASYHNSASANRREWFSASLTSYAELNDAVKMAHDAGIRIYLALNGIYSQPQYALLEQELDQIALSGIDAVIVADLGLMNKIVEDRLPLKIHVSTGGTTFNRSTVSFYKKNFNAERIVIPRHVTIDDIRDFSKTDEDVELEIFVLNGRCPNIDGFCTFHHGMGFNVKRGSKQVSLAMKLKETYMRHESAIQSLVKRTSFSQKLLHANTSCGYDYRVSVEEAGEDAPSLRTGQVRQRISDSYITYRSRYACGCCALFQLKDCKVDSLKIVGRDNATEKKLKDVNFLQNVLETLREAPDESRYTAAVKRLYRKTYGFDCNDNCYYSLTGGPHG